MSFEVTPSSVSGTARPQLRLEEPRGPDAGAKIGGTVSS